MKVVRILLRIVASAITAYFILFFILMKPDEPALNRRTGEIDFSCSSRFGEASPVVVAGKTAAFHEVSTLNSLFHPAEVVFNFVRGKSEILAEMRKRPLSP